MVCTLHRDEIAVRRLVVERQIRTWPFEPGPPRCALSAMRSMTVVCAGQQVNRIDLGSVDVGPVAALCCCTASLVSGCLPRAQLLAATRIAARMFAGPSGPASDGLRMARSRRPGHRRPPAGRASRRSPRSCPSPGSPPHRRSRRPMQHRWPDRSPGSQARVELTVPSRWRGAALSASSSPSSCAGPRCSMLREPRREAYTICTATAPGGVFTVWVPLTRRSGLPGWCGRWPAGDDWRHGNFGRRR